LEVEKRKIAPKLTKEEKIKLIKRLLALDSACFNEKHFATKTSKFRKTGVRL
jgi:hypothetical protein